MCSAPPSRGVAPLSRYPRATSDAAPGNRLHNRRSDRSVQFGGDAYRARLTHSGAHPPNRGVESIRGYPATTRRDHAGGPQGARRAPPRHALQYPALPDSAEPRPAGHARPRRAAPVLALARPAMLRAKLSACGEAMPSLAATRPAQSSPPRSVSAPIAAAKTAHCRQRPQPRFPFGAFVRASRRSSPFRFANRLPFTMLCWSLLVLVFQPVKHGFAPMEHARASAAGKARPAYSGSVRRPADAPAETRPGCASSASRRQTVANRHPGVDGELSHRRPAAAGTVGISSKARHQPAVRRRRQGGVILERNGDD